MSDDEHESLLGGGGGGGNYNYNNRNNHNKKHTKGILINRVFILILLTALVGASIYFQFEVNGLQTALDKEEKNIHDLQEQVQVHADVIRRFNESVTNADVMARLQALETELDSTQKDLEHQMDKLQDNVSTQLDSTLTELGDTVTQAKQDISDQVEKVKKDVDQYVINTQDQFSMENSFMVYQIAGTLTLLSCLISMCESETNCVPIPVCVAVVEYIELIFDCFFFKANLIILYFCF